MVERDPYARLACHERLSWTEGDSTICMRRNGDTQRLSCFDGGVRPQAATGQITTGQITTGQTAKGRVAAASEPVARAPSPAVPPPQPVSAKRFRIEVGGGYGLGNYDGTLGKMSRQVAVDSMIGARGWTAHVGIWDDKLLGNDLSLGAEYVHLNTRARISGYVANMRIGTVQFTDPARANINADVNADLIYANLAYRPRHDDTLRPFIGGGIGAGRGTLHAAYAAGDFFSASGSQTLNSWLGGAQAFGGVEIDLGWGFHLTPLARLLFFTSRPIKPHDFSLLTLEMGLGYSF